MSRRRTVTALDPADVQVETRGVIPAGAVDEAREAVAALTAVSHEPVLYARVKLCVLADPAVARPCLAQVNLDVNGRLVRAQADGETMRQAVRLLGDRARIRLRRTARDWQDVRGRRSENTGHEWRHSDLPRRATPYFPRPEGEREIVRHKSYELAWATPEEAAFDMEQLDYDFHLFTEVESGRDSVIYRGDGGYRLAQVAPGGYRPGPVSIPLTVSPLPAPALSVEDAVERLEISGLPFVFFADIGTGRGSLLYHRYDGHYGLITPSG